MSDEVDNASGDSDGSNLVPLKDTWVDVKIRVGLEKDEVIEAAAANNTSAQLRPWTLANFRGQLEPLKQIVLKAMPDLAGEIAFKENEVNEATGQERYWDVLDLLQRMTLLNIGLFPGYDPSTHPIIAYRSKATALDLYLNNPESYKAMGKIILSAFRMPAFVEAKLSQIAKIHANLAFVARAKPNEVDATLASQAGPVRKYRINDAVLFPMTAALRPLIDTESGKFDWDVDPLEFLDDNLDGLYQAFLSFYKSEVEDKTARASLSGMGKDVRLWQILHAKVLAILAKSKRK